MSLGLPPSLAGGSVVVAVPPVVTSAPQLRQMQISEWLRTQTNKHKRPFQEQTILGYAESARVLDRWMESRGIEGDSPRAT
jgi:hypothetical protein